MADTARSSRNLKIGAIVGVALMLAGAWHFGVFARLAEPRALAQTLVGMGTRGFVAFVLAYALLQPFGIPGTVFVVAAPLIWPWQTAFALSMVGTMSASVVGFSFARFVARDWVSARIPLRLRTYEAKLERNAFRTVVMLRFILWMPPALHAFFGVSRVRFWTHFWGSLLGYVVPLLVMSYLGAAMVDAWARVRLGTRPLLGALVLVLVIVGFAVARKRRRDARKVTSETPPP